MQLLSQDQRFQLANRLLDIVQTVMTKEIDHTIKPEPSFQVNMPKDDESVVEEFDRNLESHALSFLNIEGDDDGK